MPKEKAPFAPKGEYAVGAEIIWAEFPSGAVRTGQIWSTAPQVASGPAFWVVPHEPYAGEYAAQVAKARKGGAYYAGHRFAEGETFGVKNVYSHGEYVAVAA